MKRFLAMLLCLCLTIPCGALASSKAEIGFDTAVIEGTKAVLPVYISSMPDGLADISALSFEFKYDETVLEFVTISDGTITGFVDGETGQPVWFNNYEPGKVIVSWITNGSTMLYSDSTGKNNPVFSAEFTIVDDSAEMSVITITKAKLTDMELVSTTNDTLSTKSGVVFVNSNLGSDDNTGDDNTGGDNTGGDNTGGDNTGEDNGDTDSGSKPLQPAPDNTGNAANGNQPMGGTPSAGAVGGAPVVPSAPKASDIFSDVSDSHWAAKSVVKLNQLGIVSGDNQKRANLDNKITRAETSKLALLVSGKNVQSGLAIAVSDSSDIPDWAKDYMATAIAEGIFSGYEDGTVKPKNNITRAEMVAVIIKSLKIDVVAEPSLGFGDNDAISWAAPYVAKAVELGFVNGYEDNTFKPTNYITRAEAFAVFARVAEYLGK